MAVREDLIAEIEAAVVRAAQISYDDADATHDIYENYIWSMCIAAARMQGATVTFESVNGHNASHLVFRTSPGAIFSTADDYSHAVLEFSACPPLEVHVGIRVTGRSRVLHECDVAVLYRDEAQMCREEHVYPRAARVLIAVECKFYTSSIQLHLGRSFLGLARDISAKERYFVTNSQSQSVARLINHHQAEWDFNVVPQVPESQALLQRFSRAFRNFIVSQLVIVRGVNIVVVLVFS